MAIFRKWRDNQKPVQPATDNNGAGDLPNGTEDLPQAPMISRHPDNLQGLTAFLDVLLTEHSILHDAISRVESKASNLMALSIAMFSLFSIVGAKLFDKHTIILYCFIAFSLLQATILIYWWLCTKRIWVKQLTVKKSQPRYQRMMKTTDYALVERLVNDVAQVLEQNTAALVKKTSRFAWMAYLLLLSVIPLVVALAYYIVRGT